MKTTTTLALLGACALAAPASAQQGDRFAAGLATAVEGMGQSLAQSAQSGSSVFVTATGRAPLAASPSPPYVAKIEERASSAVEAARLRAAKMDAMTALARRFAVPIEMTNASFSLENAKSGHNTSLGAVGAVAVGVVAAATTSNTEPAKGQSAATAPNEPAPVFIAKVSVRFQPAAGSRLPEFLDALEAAGIDDISGGGGTSNPLAFLQNNEVLGIGAIDKVDDATWDQAARAAVAEARRQAMVLAAAAGRSLGEAHEIISLTRSVEGANATVTLAVRFALAPVK